MIKLSILIPISIILLTIIASCKKRQKYNCTITHHTNIGGGVDFVFDKEIKATYEEMLAYEEENTDSTQTATCQ